MERKSFIISFGDSDKYRVAYPGTLAEFEKSEKFRDIKETVADYLQKKFPSGEYGSTVEVTVSEDDGNVGYPDLDKFSMDELLKSVDRQVEVLQQNNEMNLNAPYDEE